MHWNTRKPECKKIINIYIIIIIVIASISFGQFASLFKYQPYTSKKASKPMETGNK